MAENQTPVVAGAAIISNGPAASDTDGSDRPDAVELMISAVRAALAGDTAPGGPAGAPNVELAGHIGWIGVPEGTWAERNPADAIGAALGLGTDGAGVRPIAVRADVGVTQDELLAAACRAISDGEVQAAVVVGGEAAYSARLAKKAGRSIDAREDCAREPDRLLSPASLGICDLEIIRDVVTPVVGFALMESTLLQARAGSPSAALIAAGRDRLSGSYAAMTAAGAANPDGWTKLPLDSDAVGSARSIAWPYTRPMCSDWTVDQAAAVVLVAADLAAELGIDPTLAVRPRATAWSNHSLTLPARPSFDHSPGAETVAQAVLADPDEVTVIDLYSCFPAAVQLWAKAVGGRFTEMPIDQLTMGGGMAHAGGPLNNSAIASWVRVIRALQAAGSASAAGLTTSVSGSFAKHGATRWMIGPADAHWTGTEVTEEVDQIWGNGRPVLDGIGPTGTVIAATIDERGPRGVAIVEDSTGNRTIAESRDPAVIAQVRDRLNAGTAIGATAGLDGGALTGLVS